MTTASVVDSTPITKLASPSDTATRTTALTTFQAREDLELTIAALEAALPDIYWHQSPREWLEAKEKARSELPEVTDSEGLWRVLMPLITRIGEGHMNLLRSEAMKQHERESGMLLPLSVHWSEGGAFVLEGYGEAADIPRGTRIISIDGKQADALMDDLMFATTHDGHIRTGVMREASGNYYGELLYRMQGSRDVFHLVLESAKGQRAERDVAGVRPSERLSPPSPDPSYVATLEWLDSATAYLSVPSFSNAKYRKAGVDYKATIQALFDQLHQRGARNLILDLRENGGGSEPNESILFSYLVEKRLHKYAAVEARGQAISVSSLSGVRFDTEVFDKDEMLLQRRLPDGRLSRRNLPPEGLVSRWSVVHPVFHGRLIVLAGGNTFSGGAELASMLFHERRAVFVGEEVGGTHEGNTSGHRWELRLPNSGMTLQIPLLQFRFVWPGVPHDRGVRPDCHVPPDASEFGQAKDTAWRTAQDLLREHWDRPGQAICPVEVRSVQHEVGGHAFTRQSSSP
jgi:hypothetical protein